MPGHVFVGTAGWAIPHPFASQFSSEGSRLERYSRLLSCVEINSSFYRPHAASTYARWAASTPDGFRFAVKLPRVITHELKLRRIRVPLERFLAETAGLAGKRGPLLVQLPPSLAFEPRVATRFFTLLRERYDGAVACEPRHESWLSAAADGLLIRHRVTRVAADPARAEGGDRPGGWGGLVYYRLHGSPRMYWSAYDDVRLAAWSDALKRAAPSAEAWCVFDNTATGAATGNACAVHASLATPPPADYD